MPDPFERLEADLTDLEDSFDSRQGGGGMFGPGFGFGFLPRAPRFPSLPASSSFANSGNWTSESYSTTTVNGATESIHKRRDFNVRPRTSNLVSFISLINVASTCFQGNEHVTRTYADGRTIRTINGVEQPSGPMGRPPQSLQYEQPSRPWSATPPPPPYENTCMLPAPPTPCQMTDFSLPASIPRDHGAYRDPTYPDSRMSVRPVCSYKSETSFVFQAQSYLIRASCNVSTASMLIFSSLPNVSQLEAEKTLPHVNGGGQGVVKSNTLRLLSRFSLRNMHIGLS